MVLAMYEIVTIASFVCLGACYVALLARALVRGRDGHAMGGMYWLYIFIITLSALVVYSTWSPRTP